MALAPLVQLAREMLRGENRRASIIVLTSAACLTAWQLTGNYNFWLAHLSGWMALGVEPKIAAGIWWLADSVLWLGFIPVFVVKVVLRERLNEYGIRLGDLHFAAVCCLLVAPLVVAIGYFSAQSPAFQAIYPLDPVARQSPTALAWHLAGQLLWYAAWEFHFRGFLQFGLEKSYGISLGIWIQALASTLAHFGRPGTEVFASILAGLLWGALAWRTRSLLAGFAQHWLLGASLDFCLCRAASG
ncbi:MAG TPA: CPBP family intramembrane glutamic endopeptidase [Pirellulales bacterium]|jgi:membrane protease YdiL (CAAX protease family)|nr:CPBP family intramembrane glutamic endopeptidase [Pirellulales bacterium]